MYWRPLPSRAPRPDENSGRIRRSAPPPRASTSPVRASTTRVPPYWAGSVAASQSSHSCARKPVPARSVFVDNAVFGVSVVAHRAGVDQGLDAGVGDRSGQHFSGRDAAVAQTLLEGTRPPALADVDAAQVDDGVDLGQRVGVELAALGIPVQFLGIRRRPAHDAQHRDGRAARSAAAKAEPIRPDEPAIATIGFGTLTTSSHVLRALDRPRKLPLRAGA